MEPEVRIVDKRGQHGRTSHKPDASQGDSELASTGPAIKEPQGIQKKVKALGEVDPAALHDLLGAVDNLKPGEAFWVRDVEYRVIDIQKNGLLILPIALGRTTLKRLRRAKREAKQ